MATLSQIIPFFITRNLRDSLAFYAEKLGFEVHHIAPDDAPFFAIVMRDGVSIMLKEITPGILPVPNHTRHEWARWDAYISTPDPDELFTEFLTAGVTFRQPVGNTDEGLRGFEIADADGYVLFFGRPK